MRSLLVLSSVLLGAVVASGDEVVARVNFQPAGSALPADFDADSGATYADARGYGWNKTVPTKERDFDADQRLDTYAFVRNGTTRTWEFALQNGSYTVKLVCGSPQWSGRHTVSIEGTIVLDSAGTHQSSVEVAAHAVTITDGRLTIKAGDTKSGRKTKLQYLIITTGDGGGGVPLPNTPPTVSTAASATTGDAPLAVTFTTTANDDEGPITSVAWTFGDGETSTELSPVHTYADVGTFTAKVVVTDAGGLTAEATVTIEVNDAGEPPPPPSAADETRINFQPPGTPPTGYFADTGEVFSTTRGYGWLDDVANKERGVDSDARRDTYCYVSNASPETWEFRIADGDYFVTLVCGSPQYTGRHTVSVEGTKVIDAVATSGSEFIEVLRHPVTVSDGRLSVRIGSGTSGKKTKLCYLIIQGTGDDVPGEVVGEAPTATVTGSPLSGDAPLAAAFTGTGEDSDGTIESYAWTFGDSATSAQASPSHTYTIPGTYVATLTVTDNDGNTVQASLTVVVTGEAPPLPPPPGIVTASVETPPVVASRDAADDPAIWVHPDDPALSVVIGTDKDAGFLFGYDLDGIELWRVQHAGQPNNVDVRGNLVGCSLSSTREIAFYLMDPETRTLTKLGEIEVNVDSSYGFTFYRSPTSGKLYAFVSGRRRKIEQYEIQTNPLSGTLVRTLNTLKGEGMAADEETGKLFMVEETSGLFVYDAEPTGGQARTTIEKTGSPLLVGELEGVTIYYAAGGKGYVIVSDQGANRYVVFNRTAPYAHVGTFEITTHPDAPGPGAHDGTSETDGIHVLNLALGDNFPFGVFVAQDGSNTRPNENQNFKLVPWERIADLLGLEKDTTHVPE